MANYIVSGGTGFIGKYLTQLLIKHQHEVYILTTKKNIIRNTNGLIHYVYWNPKEQSIDETFKLGECRIINLAGAGVADKRWSKERKKEILSSRVDSLATLYKAIDTKQIQAKHLVSASAIGFYGMAQGICKEEDPNDNSFLSSTCKQWEEAALKFQQLHIPVSIARVGIVLGKEAGAMKEFMKPLRWGIAGVPSNGKQIYSWIHIEDVSRLLFFLSSSNKIGIFNATAPHPVSANQIFKELIQHTKPFLFRIHAPQFLLTLLLGEMAIEILKSTTVSSKKIEKEGFEFLYKDIEPCVASFYK